MLSAISPIISDTTIILFFLASNFLRIEKEMAMQDTLFQFNDQIEMDMDKIYAKEMECNNFDVIFWKA